MTSRKSKTYFGPSGALDNAGRRKKRGRAFPAPTTPYTHPRAWIGASIADLVEMANAGDAGAKRELSRRGRDTDGIKLAWKQPKISKAEVRAVANPLSIGKDGVPLLIMGALSAALLYQLKRMWDKSAEPDVFLGEITDMAGRPLRRARWKPMKFQPSVYSRVSRANPHKSNKDGALLACMDLFGGPLTFTFLGLSGAAVGALVGGAVPQFSWKAGAVLGVAVGAIAAAKSRADFEAECEASKA